MLEEGLVGLRPGLLKKRQPRNENGGGHELLMASSLHGEKKK